MKKLVSGLLSLAVVLGLGTVAMASDSTPATRGEVKDAFDVTFIGKLLPDGTIDMALNDNITRAEVATLIARAEGLEGFAGTVFSDVPSGAWYEKAINAVYTEGLFVGYTSEAPLLFGPEDNMTKEQVEIVLSRYPKNDEENKGGNAWTKFLEERAVSTTYEKGKLTEVDVDSTFKEIKSSMTVPADVTLTFADNIRVAKGVTLTIAEDATVVADEDFTNRGNVVVEGTLEVDGDIINNSGTITVKTGGDVDGDVENGKLVLNQGAYANAFFTGVELKAGATANVDFEEDAVSFSGRVNFDATADLSAYDEVVIEKNATVVCATAYTNADKTLLKGTIEFKAGDDLVDGLFAVSGAKIKVGDTTYTVGTKHKGEVEITWDTATDKIKVNGDPANSTTI